MYSVLITCLRLVSVSLLRRYFMKLSLYWSWLLLFSLPRTELSNTGYTWSFTESRINWNKMNFLGISLIFNVAVNKCGWWLPHWSTSSWLLQNVWGDQLKEGVVLSVSLSHWGSRGLDALGLWQWSSQGGSVIKEICLPHSGQEEKEKRTKLGSQQATQGCSCSLFSILTSSKILPLLKSTRGWGPIPWLVGMRET